MHDRCWGEVNKLKPWWIFFQNWYNMYYPGGYESECKNGNVLCQCLFFKLCCSNSFIIMFVRVCRKINIL